MGKNFYFVNDVVSASGWQRYYVEADTLEEAKALKKYDPNNVLFDDEDVEVTDLGPDQWEDDE